MNNHLRRPPGEGGAGGGQRGRQSRRRLDVKGIRWSQVSAPGPSTSTSSGSSALRHSYGEGAAEALLGGLGARAARIAVPAVSRRHVYAPG